MGNLVDKSWGNLDVDLYFKKNDDFFNKAHLLNLNRRSKDEMVNMVISAKSSLDEELCTGDTEW